MPAKRKSRAKRPAHLVKGSPAAKKYMAELRAMRGVGSGVRHRKRVGGTVKQSAVMRKLKALLRK